MERAPHSASDVFAWKDLFQPAIFYADHGYPVAEIIHAYLDEAARVRSRTIPKAERVFCRNGKAPELGEIFSNPDFAKALRLVADKGADAFYKGEIAQAILADFDKRSAAPWPPTTSRSFTPEWVEPISTTYRGWTVYELPPNGQGMAALEMLNIMETSPARPTARFSVAELHKKIEAMKLAYADLYRYDADPRFAKVPVKGLLSKDYAQERAN